MTEEYNQIKRAVEILAGIFADSLFDGLQAEFIGTAAALMPGYDYELPEGVVVTMEPECDPDLDVVLIPYGEEMPASCLYLYHG